MRWFLLITLCWFAKSGLAADEAYQRAATSALAKGGVIVVLSDLHLTVDANGQLEGTPNQRLEATKAWLRQNRGRVAQIVWMGDLLDAAKGPKTLDDRLALMRLVIQEVGIAAELPAISAPQSELANHIFVMGNHDMIVDMPAFKAAKDRFEVEVVPTLKKGPDGKPDRSEYLLRRPIPDNYADQPKTQRVVDLWKTLGYVATEGSLDAKEVILRGFDARRFGRRRGFILEHVPKSNGGDFQLQKTVISEGQSKLADSFETAMISETAIGRINGDLHDPHNMESPPLAKEHGHYAPSHAAADEYLIFRSLDAGTLGSPLVTCMPGGGDCKTHLPLPNTFVIISPTEGGTAYHFSVNDEGIEPFQLPPSKRTFSVPTRTFADSGDVLRDPHEELLKRIYREHETCRRGWELLAPE